eukprot:TRINITY_DN10345_c0_g2_i1.p1 TRINITY_DN10345_c0_g2~~TRINITY_DN10345_c0_g2_i1.p1  ORF type:complete len:615 (+),score=120.92 TRINITY_DN10345_c0_g2_i1:64-1908(+)
MTDLHELDNGWKGHAAPSQTLTEAETFRAGLESYLAEVRQYVVAEVARLEASVAALSKDPTTGGCERDHGHVITETLSGDKDHTCSGQATVLSDIVVHGALENISSSHNVVQGGEQAKLTQHGQSGDDADLSPMPGEVKSDLRQEFEGTRNDCGAAFNSQSQTARVMGKRFSVETQERKQRIREALASEVAEENRSDAYHEGYAQRIVMSAWFENITMMVVLINAVWIAIDLDMNPGDGHPVFLVMSNFFCTCFTLELAFRFAARKNKCGLLCNRWFVFDFFLVTLMVLEVWIVPFLTMIFGGSSDSALGSASVLRLLRLLRVTRMAKAMRAMPELMIMIKGILAGLRSVGASLIILFAVTYVFAILFRQLTAGSAVGDEFFSTVPNAAYALFIQSCLPDNGDTLDLLLIEQWMLGILFVLFLGLTSMTVMNMLLGVMCEVMHHVSNDRHRQLLEEEMAVQIRRALLQHHGIDADIEDHITKDDLLVVLDNANAVRALQDLAVDVLALAEDADVLFDGASGKGLTFQEFAEVLAMFHNSHGATYRAMSGLRKRMNIATSEITGVHSDLKEMSQVLLDEVKAMRSDLDEKQKEVPPTPKDGDAASPPFRGHAIDL